MEQHKHSLELMKNASTPTERQELQQRYGVSWSVLCKLPYFDIVKYHLIDPMHNFYLGTAKHMVKIWKDRGLLNQENLILIQSRIDEINIELLLLLYHIRLSISIIIIIHMYIQS